MMSAEVLFIGSAACFLLSFFHPIESLLPVGLMMAVMAGSIWIRAQSKK